ncbi:hypothetical protein GCM10010211_61390 [Streptomyces albospinus]|uniref:Uncharacterized protein n=1 Tax=Streptomyces albospinus TaxID=285515 RepID=A0ABQ2VHA4_9ACTN|nr:hypothetical protein GCM10010211_61390 [Streptomyces albospinus]
MPLADRFLTNRREWDSKEILARGGDPEVHSGVQRVDFVPVVRVHGIYRQAPTDLDANGETCLAAEAVAHLRIADYRGRRHRLRLVRVCRWSPCAIRPAAGARGAVRRRSEPNGTGRTT